MFIGRVVGTTWGTRKHPSLEHKRWLLVAPIHGITKEVLGEPQLAVDMEIDAGLGDVVLVMDEGNSARQILKDDRAPIRTIVCGIVDHVQMRNQTVRYH